MCGILGAVLYKEGCDEKFKTLFRNSLELIEHRGPDALGTYYSNNLAMGHVRLSILDTSSAADQPMISRSSDGVIAYNGEVYNFQELQKRLEDMGANFRSRSDTEVVLEHFHYKGLDGLADLNGMFAFAYVDESKNKLFLAKDRFGIKPLYYCDTSSGFYYSSEIKALESLIGGLEPDIRVLSEWTYYGNTLGENTMYTNVKKLLPGRCLEFCLKRHSYSLKRYWEPPLKPVAKSSTEEVDESVFSNVRDLLERAVKKQLVSDVPVGVFLSGGIDSSAITAFASRHYEGDLNTYSVAFDFDKGVNELPRARQVAEMYGTDHHEVVIGGYDLADTVESLVSSFDGPFSDAANIPLYLLAQKVKDKAKVILQGDGGDEIFAGYQRYNTLSKIEIMKFLARIGRYVNPLTLRNLSFYSRRRYINTLSSKADYRLFSSLLTVEDVNDPPTAIFSGAFRKEVEASLHDSRYKFIEHEYRDIDIVNRMLLVDLQIILPDIFLEKVDRSTMAGSIEVRVPFLDNELVDYCVALPSSLKVKSGCQKYLLKKSLEGIVPLDILYGKKTGFGVPFGFWLKGPLKELFFDNLSRFEHQNPRVLDVDNISQMYTQHIDGKRDYGFLLWKVLNFMIWGNSKSFSFI